MIGFIKQMGSYGPPLLMLAAAIAILAIKKVFDLFIRKGLDAVQLEKGLHAILFWGFLSAVMGFLGQAHGLYNAFKVIARAREIDPNIVAMGFAESLTTTITGLYILMFSAIIWFALFTRYKRMTATS
ncbi:MAG: MotA/TolQ/ExbB proton channel family protein [bacterium]|nr:MAG: MotA/TolQ/ExbB proton channel family protein [bacterium]